MEENEISFRINIFFKALRSDNSLSLYISKILYILKYFSFNVVSGVVLLVVMHRVSE